MATDWAHAVMAFLQLAGLPCEPAKPCHRVLPVLRPDGVMVLERELGVQPTPSHRIASLLNGVVLVLAFTTAAGGVFLLRKIAASVFPWSKATPLFAAQWMPLLPRHPSRPLTIQYRPQRIAH